jgi:hypothetical protein
LTDRRPEPQREGPARPCRQLTSPRRAGRAAARAGGAGRIDQDVTGFILALIHRWNLPQFLFNWQTLIAGVLAGGAAVATIWVTRSTASEQIKASREQADKMVAAAHEQTSVAAEQISQTYLLARRRDDAEAEAFRVMLEAAMARVLFEAAGARKTYPPLNPRSDPTLETYAVRQCIIKGAFAELRGACVRQGSPLTGEFLDLEREIDSFAAQWGTYALSGAAAMPVRKGNHAGLIEQLVVIEAKATELQPKAAPREEGDLNALFS